MRHLASRPPANRRPLGVPTPGPRLGRGLRGLLGRSVAALAVTAIALSSGAPPASAWANHGDGFGTHDWILSQAIRVLGGTPEWLNLDLALAATDDPDSVEKVADPFVGAWHVYKEKGRRGGAPTAILMRYAQAAEAYQQGQALELAGDPVGARAAYDQASYFVGLLAHYEGDIAQPFHTYHDVVDGGYHSLYENDLVEPLTRAPDDMPAWQSSVRGVAPSCDVRRTAVGTAAWSRRFYAELRRHLVEHPRRLDARASEITGLIMKRTAVDLASIIAAVPSGCGTGKALTIRVRTVDHTPSLNGYVTIRIHVTDTTGAGVEGLMFVSRDPVRGGGTVREMWATDGNGNAHFYVPTRGLRRGARYSLPITVQVGTTLVSRPQWFVVASG